MLFKPVMVIAMLYHECVLFIPENAQIYNESDLLTKIQHELVLVFMPYYLCFVDIHV